MSGSSQQLRAFDAHCHLGFMADGEKVAAEAWAAGVGLASMTVDPRAFDSEAARFSRLPGVVVGAGLHPWWAAGAEEDGRLEALCGLASRVRVIGEVGLDFGPRFAATAGEQLRAFRAIAEACAREGGRVVSIHAVRAAGDVLDVLEETGCLRVCACVLHWFSGTSEELSRAVAGGCYFSIGERMMATRRGRAYARAIPADRLLLETDAPPTPPAPRERSAPSGGLAESERPPVPAGVSYGGAELAASLDAALAAIERERGERLASGMAKAGASLFLGER